MNSLTNAELETMASVISGELLTMDLVKARVPQIDTEPRKLELLMLRSKLQGLHAQAEQPEETPVRRKKGKK